MRASTKKRTETVAAAMRAEKALLDAMSIRSKPKIKQSRLKQSDMLIEAAKTEIENKKSLDTMLMLAEEKRRDMLPKKPFIGAQIKFNSKIGRGNTITFTDVHTFPKCISSGPIPCKFFYVCFYSIEEKKRLCLNHLFITCKQTQ